MQTVAMKFYGTSIGKKVVMAITGVILFAFVIVHMLGNLQVFSGATKLNHYADFLKSIPSLLWTARLFLLCAVSLHVISGIQLKLQSWRSRPVGYNRFTPVDSTLSSRNMIWTGIMVGFFVVYHILHLTTGTLHPVFNVQDVYENVIIGFSSWPVSAAYIVAMIGLGLHLYHGVWSMFQSLGLTHPKYNALRRIFATGITFIFVIGNISMPVAILVSQYSR